MYQLPFWRNGLVAGYTVIDDEFVEPLGLLRWSVAGSASERRSPRALLTNHPSPLAPIPQHPVSFFVPQNRLVKALEYRTPEERLLLLTPDHLHLLESMLGSLPRIRVRNGDPLDSRLSNLESSNPLDTKRGRGTRTSPKLLLANLVSLEKAFDETPRLIGTENEPERKKLAAQEILRRSDSGENMTPEKQLAVYRNYGVELAPTQEPLDTPEPEKMVPSPSPDWIQRMVEKQWADRKEPDTENSPGLGTKPPDGSGVG